MLYWGVHFPDERVVGFKEFPEDQLIFYKGFYGVPSYLVWYARPWPDKPHMISVGELFEFMVFEAPKDFDSWNFRYKNPDFEDDMYVESVNYDVTRKMFKIVAVSHFWKVLSTMRLITHLEVGKRDAPVSGIDVIKELIEMANVNKIKKCFVSPGISKPPKIRYVNINVDPETSVLDIITKICWENSWEWFIGSGSIDTSRTHILYIGEKLVLNNAYAFPFTPEPEHAKIIEISDFKSITTEGIWVDPMTVYGNPVDSRVIWIKAYLGNHGGPITVMLHKMGEHMFQYLSENDYLTTLDGLAKGWGEQRRWKILRSFPVLIGKMYGEFGPDETDEYTTPLFSADIDTLTKDLATRTFKTSYPEGDQPLLQTKNNKITTPYAGNGVGVQYPQAESHRLLFAPDGERDIALVGPAYYGPGDEVPYRVRSKDYRLQLPDGTVVYNKNDNIFYIIGSKQIDLKVGGLGVDQDPGSAATFPSIIIKDGEINIQTNISTQVKLTNNGITIKGQQIDGLQPTLKITSGKIEILGELKVIGSLFTTSLATPLLPDVEKSVLAKIKPGP